MENQTEEEGRKVWQQIFKSDMFVKKRGGNTYIGYLGMFIKLSHGQAFMMNRETEKWDEVDGLTLQPLKVKGQRGRIHEDRNEGYEGIHENEI